MIPYVSLPAPPGNQTNSVGSGERQVTRELGKEDHPSWEVLIISLPEEVKTARQHRCTGESGSVFNGQSRWLPQSLTSETDV